MVARSIIACNYTSTQIVGLANTGHKVRSTHALGSENLVGRYDLTFAKHSNRLKYVHVKLHVIAPVRILYAHGTMYAIHEVRNRDWSRGL